MARSSFVRFGRAVPDLRPYLPAALACLAILLLTSSTSLAQSSGIAVPGAQSNLPLVEKFTLTGTVIDSVTGEPIRRALVQLYGRQRRTAFSDGDGHFELEGIPADTYTVTAQKPGYFNQQELLRGAVPPVDVGPKTASAVVKLVPEAVIAGRVADSSEVPLEHVSVNLEYVEVREGRRHRESKGSAITDEDGRFRFANLKPGTYFLNASPYTPLAETMLDANTPPKTGYSGVYYEGATDLASASPIQLTAGQQAEANFALTEAPVYAVSGTVSGYGPHQGVGIQVFDQSGLQTDRGAIFNSENGRFDIHALAARELRHQGVFIAGPKPVSSC